MKDKVIELTKSLIERPSITPNDAGCQQLLSDRLTKIGFDCESMRFGDVDNLWARIGDQAPLFVFAGHTDVVPTGPESDWTSPPFAPEIRDGFLYGRGASDMKSAIAAMVIAVETFLQNSPNFKGSIAFLITSDEEADAINGTEKVIEVLQKRGEKIDFCLIGEPSSDKKVGDQIRIGRRGSLHGKLRVQGKQGHVAHPHLAINPIHKAMLALHELTMELWDEGNAHFPKTSLQISNLNSGTGAANVVPGHLDARFNFRFGTAITEQALQSRTEEIFKKHQLNFNIDWHIGGKSFLTPHGKLIAATQQAIKKITGLTTNLSTGGGTSDGRFIAVTGAEIVELGVSHATAHQIDESVNIDELHLLSMTYIDILILLLTSLRE